MSRVIDAFAQYFDGAGEPLVNGWLRFLVSGTNNTDKDTFKDSSENVANTNPVQLDGEGRCPDVFGTGSYRVILYTNDTLLNQPSEQVQVFDPVGGAQGVSDFNDYDASATYDEASIVKGSDGDFYESLSGSNVNNDPTTTPAYWKQIDFLEMWNATITYSIGDRVTDTINGFDYISKIDSNLNNQPSTHAVTEWSNFAVDASAAEVATEGAAQIVLIEAAGDSELSQIAAAGDSELSQIGAAGDSELSQIAAAGDSELSQIGAAGDSELSDISTAGSTQVALVEAATADFETKYLGSKSSDPTVDNEGGALIDGALYWNTTDNKMKTYDLGGTTWVVWVEGLQQVADDTTPALGGTLTGGGNRVDNVVFNDVADLTQNLGSISGATAINYSSGQHVIFTVSAATTLSFTNPPPAGQLGIIILEITNGGAHTITWPASVAWDGGTAPTLQTSGTDIITFITRDAGTTWRAVRGWKEA